jgi:HEAT repeat protein
MNIDTTSDRFAVIEAGFSGNSETAERGLQHADAAVRASSLRALHRLSSLNEKQLAHGLTDSSAEVRRTAVEVAVGMQQIEIHSLLNDDDVFVAEMTAWCLGERVEPTDAEINALMNATLHHSEAVVREASAAALGSLGDERGLPAILAACSDKPAVRRRAVLALAPFEGDAVEEALRAALEDRDWQVRQNAEILLNPRD